jgi:Asp-tRNA(Asn)/Glu-tRNA(Gln) amidotransferase C subunit
MQRLSPLDLRRVAARCALRLSDDDIENAAADLDRLLAAFEAAAAEGATSLDEPLRRTMDPREREDVAVPWNDPDTLIACARRTRGRYIVVPRILQPSDED